MRTIYSEYGLSSRGFHSDCPCYYGMKAQISISNKAMELLLEMKQLPVPERDQVETTLGKFVLVAERIIGDGDGLAQGGYSQFVVLNFLIRTLHHIDAFFDTVSTTSGNFPVEYLEDDPIDICTRGYQ